MCTTASATCCTSISGSTAIVAVRLRHALRHPLGHLGERVADVDLAAGDVVLAAVERGRLGEAGDRVLGGGVGRGVRPRRVRGDRAVVDDAPAARRLVLHQPEGFLRAQERAGQVDVDDALPLLERQVLERDAGRVLAGVVEEHVEPAELLLRGREQGARPSPARLTSVGTASARAPCVPGRLDGLLERIGAAPASATE